MDAPSVQSTLVSMLPPSSDVALYGEVTGESCGYCHAGHSCNYGVSAVRMLPEDYEALMLRGFRRSGDYLYKPVMYKTCCPQYTIRLRAASFKPDKSQRYLMRRFDRYLQEGQAFTEHRASPSAGVKDRTCATEDVEMPVTTPESTPPPPLPGASTIDTFSVPLKPSAPQSITVDTGLAEFTEEGFALYCKYQKSVHGDPDSKLSPEGYTNFLVASPFPQNAANRPLASGKDKKRGRTSEDVSLGSSSGAAKPRMLGTYHQQYRIDGRLVAVGVVDFVPSGLSSVYCFYDPELKHLALGKYTALREIQYCLDHGLDFYYMGYYIHTCPKMRYKGDYVPSELLCPTTFTWHHLRDCVPLLDQNKFTPLSPGLIKPYQTLRAAIDKVNENNDAGSVENVASAKPPTSSDIKDEKMISKLKHFFGPDADKKLTYNPNMCLMKMSDNRPLNIHMFRAEYRAEIASLVNEWLRLIGPDNFKRFGVVFS